MQHVMHLVTSFFVSVSFSGWDKIQPFLQKKLKYQPGCHFYNLKSIFLNRCHICSTRQWYILPLNMELLTLAKLAILAKKSQKQPKYLFFNQGNFRELIYWNLNASCLSLVTQVFLLWKCPPSTFTMWAYSTGLPMNRPKIYPRWLPLGKILRFSTRWKSEFFI